MPSIAALVIHGDESANLSLLFITASDSIRDCGYVISGFDKYSKYSHKAAQQLVILYHVFKVLSSVLYFIPIPNA